MKFGFITDSPSRINGKIKNSYSRWKSMVSRCYNKKDRSYKNYGAKGIYVCEEWKLFSNFERWFDENYIEGYVMDKDISGKGYYGPDSVVFISSSDNNKEKNKRQNFEHMLGEGNINAKPLDYYSKHPTRRDSFKRTCKRYGVDFDMFEEIQYGFHIKPNGDKIKKFIYKMEAR